MSTTKGDYFARVYHSDGKRYKQKVWSNSSYGSKVQEWLVDTVMTGGQYKGTDAPGTEHGWCPAGSEENVTTWKQYKPEKVIIGKPGL